MQAKDRSRSFRGDVPSVLVDWAGMVALGFLIQHTHGAHGAATDGRFGLFTHDNVLYHAVTRAHPRRSGASDAWSCSRICVQFILGGRRFTFGRRGDAPRLLVHKGPVTAELAEIYIYPAQY